MIENLTRLFADRGYLPADAPGDFERVALIDLDAVEHNVRRIRELIGDRTLIAVVKADAYGHGAVDVGRAALAAGADRLGVVHVREASALRRAGITAPLIAWLHTPRTDFAQAVRDGLELGISNIWELDAIAAAHEEEGLHAPVALHLKVDTGLGRNGSSLAELPAVAARARELEKAGKVWVEGLLTHLAVADEPERAETPQQVGRFEDALVLVREAGLNPTLLHVANSPATLSAGSLDARVSGTGELYLKNAVRVGLGLYGLSPLPGVSAGELGLAPAMHLQTFISGLKEVPAGQGVSYGLNYVTDRPTTLALIPMGYADGVPRVADGGPVRIYPQGAEPRTYRVVGRVAMDQMVVDLGAPGLSDPALGYLGAPAVLFGAGQNPPVEAWAEAAGTINYEIVTRISPRVSRISLGGSAGTGSQRQD